jgi:hypothetical protein
VEALSHQRRMVRVLFVEAIAEAEALEGAHAAERDVGLARGKGPVQRRDLDPIQRQTLVSGASSSATVRACVHACVRACVVPGTCGW